MKVFHTEKEFQQSSLDNVARLISEFGADYIASGNIADVCEEVLEYLENIALSNDLSPFAITAYLDIIKTENDQMREELDF